MFVTDVKIGLSSSLLPAETVEKITKEQELEELRRVVLNYDQRENRFFPYRSVYFFHI